MSDLQLIPEVRVGFNTQPFRLPYSEADAVQYSGAPQLELGVSLRNKLSQLISFDVGLRGGGTFYSSLTSQPQGKDNSPHSFDFMANANLNIHLGDLAAFVGGAFYANWLSGEMHVGASHPLELEGDPLYGLGGLLGLEFNFGVFSLDAMVRYKHTINEIDLELAQPQKLTPEWAFGNSQGQDLFTIMLGAKFPIGL